MHLLEALQDDQIKKVVELSLIIGAVAGFGLGATAQELLNLFEKHILNIQGEHATSVLSAGLKTAGFFSAAALGMNWWVIKQDPDVEQSGQMKISN